MKIVRARAMGMCFGVRDALATVRSLPDPQNVTIYGELVHNPKVLEEISARGIRQVDEARRDGAPETPAVLITAHGLSDEARSRLESAGKQLIDTTCPLVRRVHETAQLFQRQGWFLVVIGRRDHVEVQGIIGDLTRFDVVEKGADARRYDAARIAVIAQTTTPPTDAEMILQAITAANPQSQIRWIDTICRPTRERQEAIEELLNVADALVVVGGRNSNNTRRLVDRARERAIPVQHVESAAELDLERLGGCDVVGLTAGTSTLENTISEVEAALEEFAQQPQKINSSAAPAGVR